MYRFSALGQGLLAGVMLTGIVSTGLTPSFGAAAGLPPEFSPNSAVGWIAYGSEFLPPVSGSGPVTSDPAHPRVSNNEAEATGRQPTFHIGDPGSSILQPWAKEAIRKRNEQILSGKPGYTRQVGCWPMGVPAFLLYPIIPIYFVQAPKEVLLISGNDQQLRHIYMNVPHSTHVTPSWYGESVGHYEGDTLVVDTVGMNDQTYVDNYRTPHTGKLHTVERFHLVDGGRSLEVDLHVDDPGTFTTSWNALQRYRRSDEGPMLEMPCAENNANYFGYDVERMPQASKPDF